MDLFTLALRSARFYWRTHLGVVAGTALAAMVLTGSLLVGDSVKATLRAQALDRVGQADLALAAEDRFFRAALGDEVEARLGGGAVVAPVFFLLGSVTTPDGSARVNRVQVVGIDDRFWKLSSAGRKPTDAAGSPGAAFANERLARQLGAAAGDALVLRVEEPGNLSRDAPLSGARDAVVGVRVALGGVVGDGDYGRFSLQGGQVPPHTLFVPAATLQKEMEREGQANLLLAGRPGGPPLTADAAQAALGAVWNLADASLEVRDLDRAGVWELRTSRVFLDPAVEAAADALGLPSTRVLSYFVNSIETATRTAPYSVVAAVEPGGAGPVPPDTTADEVIINQWLADDTGARPGDEITLHYYAVGERRELEERARTFRVRTVAAMTPAVADPAWMPDFPGLVDAENCRDWNTGTPIDLDRVLQQDQDYWDAHKGSPKAFITLAAGQEMWANRWGRLTAVRFPKSATDRDAIAAGLKERIDPAGQGLRFQDLRGNALASLAAPVDFAGLFLGFSSFLIGAAAALTGLLFVFSLEQRRAQAGLLLALGFSRRRVGRLLTAEGTVLAAAGALLGSAAALGYTAVVLHLLSTVWKGAVGTVTFAFAAPPASLLGGFAASVAVAVGAMWLAGRKQHREPARALLAAPRVDAGAGEPGVGEEEEGAPVRRRWDLIAAGVLAAAAAAALVAVPEGAAQMAVAGQFFGAGFLLLAAGLLVFRAWLLRQSSGGGSAFDLAGLGRRNLGRRRGRSLAVGGVLAAGVFMVVAVSAFRLDSAGEAAPNGTGGFSLLAESSLPLYDDLNTAEGREVLGVSESDLAGVTVVPFRAGEGDDASCLNLTRAVKPRLLGVLPEELEARRAFLAAGVGGDAFRRRGWHVLDDPLPGGAVPAVADAATAQYALKIGIGDTLEYEDGRGETFALQLVGTVSGTLLQGNLLIAEEQFTARFPGRGGFRYFLIDAPAEKGDAVAAALTRSLGDLGLEVVPAAARLAEFEAVQNTYLAIFQALGGLGLLLGTAGLAIVVLRNLLERRAEFGLLEALGFRAEGVRRLLVGEHRWLILWGLVIGAVAALASSLPALLGRAGDLPGAGLVALVAGLLASGLFWVWLAVRTALRGGCLGALRDE